MYKISYVADGATTEFAFSFPFFQISDVRVAINFSVNDAAYNYAIMPNEDLSGGNIVFDDAPVAGTRIDIFRQIALTRTIDYQPTQEIDPENLNSDFNFLLSAIQDLYSLDIDFSEWKNQYDEIKIVMKNTLSLLQNENSAAGISGLYRNLLTVLESALPKLINDYGYITDVAPNENRDDYGVL